MKPSSPERFFRPLQIRRYTALRSATHTRASLLSASVNVTLSVALVIITAIVWYEHHRGRQKWAIEAVWKTWSVYSDPEFSSMFTFENWNCVRASQAHDDAHVDGGDNAAGSAIQGQCQKTRAARLLMLPPPALSAIGSAL